MKNTQYVWSTVNSHGMFAATIVILSLILVSSPMFSIQPQAELKKIPLQFISLLLCESRSRGEFVASYHDAHLNSNGEAVAGAWSP